MGNEKQEEKQGMKNEQIRQVGSLNLNENKEKHKIKLLTIIGEVEGHEAGCPEIQKPRNTSTSSRCLQRWRTARKSKGF